MSPLGQPRWVRMSARGHASTCSSPILNCFCYPFHQRTFHARCFDCVSRNRLTTVNFISKVSSSKVSSWGQTLNQDKQGSEPIYDTLRQVRRTAQPAQSWYCTRAPCVPVCVCSRCLLPLQVFGFASQLPPCLRILHTRAHTEFG